MSMTTAVRCCSLSLSALLLVACGGESPSKSPAASAPAVATPASAPAAKTVAVDARTMKQAKAQFESLCVTCHGSSGHGDGPGAATLEPKPRSFADTKWQASVTDEQIKKAIVFGGAAVGKSAMMPAQPQLKGQTTLLDGLVQIVRAFKGQE
jgi:mono/diheme cytochrome c family protein